MFEDILLKNFNAWGNFTRLFLVNLTSRIISVNSLDVFLWWFSMKCVLHISCKNSCYWLFTEDFFPLFWRRQCNKKKAFFDLLYFSFGLFVPSACCVKGVNHICATLQEMKKYLCSGAVEVILSYPKDDLCGFCFKGRQQTNPQDIGMKSLLFFWLWKRNWV